MSFNVYKILEIEDLEYNEQIIDLSSSNNNASQFVNQVNLTNDLPQTEVTPWIVSTKMKEIMTEFENTILSQFLYVPCSICSKLMYSKKSSWIQQDPSVSYPLANYIPLVTNPIPPTNRIAICQLCKSDPNRNYPLYFAPTPTEIESVLLKKCKYLSLIFLHCSLGRTPGANPFSEYRTLVDTMNYSQNFYSLSMYSGLLGVYLESSSSIPTKIPPWFDNSLTNAINWLKEHNLYIHQYLQMLSSFSNTNPRLPVATHSIIDENTPLFQKGDIVVPHQNFPTEIYNEDANYQIIERSTYTDGWRYDEEKTTPIPTFIRTGDSYFQKKNKHLNTMIHELGLLTLFIILSMAEGSWTHLHNILINTDNHDSLLTNRPLHTTLHFIHRLQNIKKSVRKNPEISEWETYSHFFDRIEFQNHGAAHLYEVYCTTTSILEIINLNTIRSTLPDPNLEPELYQRRMYYKLISTSTILNIRSSKYMFQGSYPLYMINSLDDDPYWTDKIEKYFARLHNSIFDNMIYKTYFETYNIKSTRPTHSLRTVYQDDLGNFIVERTNHILTRM
ncbi:20477_t:CDS:2 [Cetraspora pellucida]|uniref:20477_t:CDS:1 n=1 Tax=Cetraspora pellucida TaxID=1433469 RepID=A0A9N9EQC0_9GLOM|nr:20477_t:CDS:2 [Cetraspora pellucida]